MTIPTLNALWRPNGGSVIDDRELTPGKLRGSTVSRRWPAPIAVMPVVASLVAVSPANRAVVAHG
jgi:hypothetical protein